MSLDGQLERLCALYDEKSDDELLGMYDNRDDLTEVAQEALAQTMRERRLVGRVQAAAEEDYRQAEGESRSITLDRSEVALWTFTDAFEAKEALRLLGDAGIWHRVADQSTKTDEGIRGRVLVGLLLIVQQSDYDAAAELLEQKMNLFPKVSRGGGFGAPLIGMQEMMLLSMFDRHEGLVAAEALGKAGISYCWRDGADDSQELPDEQTVAIEVRGEQMEVATGVVEKALAASDAESLPG